MTLAGFLVGLYLLAIVCGLVLLVIVYYLEFFSEHHMFKRDTPKEFFTNPGIIIFHIMWLYLVWFGIYSYVKYSSQ